MARRASSHDRLEKLRAEAAATEREKEEKRKAKAAAPAKPRKRRAPAKSKKPVRMMIIWAVCDETGEEVCRYPFPHQSAAASEAARLTKVEGAQHSVERMRVPFEETSG